jgi:type IV secretion system protein VirB11
LKRRGYPGGVSTFHADSAEESLPRLEELVEEAGFGPKRPLIGRAVDLVVYMEKTLDNQRRISSIIKVIGYNSLTATYDMEKLYAATA